MLLGGPLTYRTLHFLMIKLCISKVSNTEWSHTMALQLSTEKLMKSGIKQWWSLPSTSPVG